MKQIIPIYNTFHLYLHKYIYEIKAFIMFIVKLLTVMYDYKSLLLKKMGKLIKPIKNLSPNVKSIRHLTTIIIFMKKCRKYCNIIKNATRLFKPRCENVK